MKSSELSSYRLQIYIFSLKWMLLNKKWVYLQAINRKAIKLWIATQHRIRSTGLASKWKMSRMKQIVIFGRKQKFGPNARETEAWNWRQFPKTISNFAYLILNCHLRFLNDFDSTFQFDSWNLLA